MWWKVAVVVVAVAKEGGCDGSGDGGGGRGREGWWLWWNVAVVVVAVAKEGGRDGGGCGCRGGRGDERGGGGGCCCSGVCCAARPRVWSSSSSGSWVTVLLGEELGPGGRSWDGLKETRARTVAPEAGGAKEGCGCAVVARGCAGGAKSKLTRSASVRPSSACSPSSCPRHAAAMCAFRRQMATVMRCMSRRSRCSCVSSPRRRATTFASVVSVARQLGCGRPYAEKIRGKNSTPAAAQRSCDSLIFSW